MPNKAERAHGSWPRADDGQAPTVALVHVLPDDIEILVREGETILDAIRASGFTHRYGCRRGGCGTCKITVVEGSAHLTATVAESALSRQEIDAGVLLSCRSAPTTDTTIQLMGGDRLRPVAPFLAALRRSTDWAECLEPDAMTNNTKGRQR